jgi:hypothetical protein
MGRNLVAVGLLAGMWLGAPAEVTVPSRTGWQAAPPALTAGQSFRVAYRPGSWAVGHPGLAHVGINGYDPAADGVIFQDCKIRTDPTYGHPRARAGAGPPFAVAHSGTFTAPAAGRLAMRINDGDRCPGDDAGAVVLSAGTDGGPPTAAPPNGCTSPAGNAPARWLVDTGASFLDACNAHDRCYRDHALTREGCDADFRRDMKASCAKATEGNVWHAGYCYAWANEYWAAVRRYGAVFYLTRKDPSFFPHQWPRPPSSSHRLAPDRHVTVADRW